MNYQQNRLSQSKQLKVYYVKYLKSNQTKYKIILSVKQICLSRGCIRRSNRQALLSFLILLLGSLRLFCCKIKLVLSGRKKVGLGFFLSDKLLWGICSVRKLNYFFPKKISLAFQLQGENLKRRKTLWEVRWKVP